MTLRVAVDGRRYDIEIAGAALAPGPVRITLTGTVTAVRLTTKWGRLWAAMRELF